MRPLAVDVATFLLPLAGAVPLFLVGRGFRTWPRATRGLALAVALAVLTVGGVSLAGVLPFAADRWAFRLGGTTSLLCWLAAFLLGVVWAVPNRSLSSPFLAILAGVALVVIGIESSGRLWWRLVSPDIWERTPDETGLLRQSSAVTCSPTAAAMLLHLHGVTAGEGELAYLAGTTPLGTDAPGIVRALDAKAGSQGWHAEAGRTTYGECLRRGEPFLAHVRGQYLGHAVVVARIGEQGVSILDPADGKVKPIARAEFEENWDGTAVRLVR